MRPDPYVIQLKCVPGAKSNMNWRYIAASLIVGLFFFAAIFMYDMCCGWNGYEEICGNPSPSWISQICSGQFDREIAGIYSTHFLEARTLICEFNLLTWLTNRGELAFSAAIVGLLLPSFILNALHLKLLEAHRL